MTSDKHSFGFEDQQGFEKVMADYEKKTVDYRIGFLQAAPNSQMVEQTGNALIPCFVIKDNLFPRGNIATDIASWDFRCNGIGRHIMLPMSITNDRTGEKRDININICPFALALDKGLKKQISNLVIGSDPSKCPIGLFGERMIKAFIGQEPITPDYDRLAAHVGTIDFVALTMNFIMSELNYRNPDILDRSKHCKYCRMTYPK